MKKRLVFYMIFVITYVILQMLVPDTRESTPSYMGSLYTIIVVLLALGIAFGITRFYNKGRDNK
ncbi:hypothetical protein [Aquibacillus rhizosphaerae]|uniref:Uncharacterized protein n=1 Tax=Aquibacillus rhizosphaerae TaxID=3051431 RepID=A0ABT7L6Y8_9BACI|nr:hypothetical protein [Aquibacillus sp. LR5S19]MDL4841618.1 hypothetical protein [Aquibacillus sp. LR5S19]